MSFNSRKIIFQVIEDWNCAQIEGSGDGLTSDYLSVRRGEELVSESRQDDFFLCTNRATGLTGLVPCHVLRQPRQIIATVPAAPHRMKAAPECVSAPRLCALCLDYVWGGWPNASTCSRCGALFHSEVCAGIASHQQQRCQGGGVNAPKCAAITAQPRLVHSWLSEDVLQWLTSVNLARFVEAFRALLRNADDPGVVLAELSDDALQTKLAVNDSEQRRVILTAVAKLREGNQHNNFFKIAALSDSAAGGELALSSTSTSEQHMWRLASFAKQRTCDFCQQPLLGLCRQGMKCVCCRKRVHRRCSMFVWPDALHVCNKKMQASPLSPLQSCDWLSWPFGAPLAISSARIFPLIKHCCDVVEKDMRGLDDPFKVYREPRTLDMVARLKRTFKSKNGLPPAQLTPQFESLDRSTAAQLLKLLLQELPESVIPAPLYHDFVSAAQQADMAARATSLRRLVLNRLLEPHRDALRLLMAHFLRMFGIMRHRRLTHWSQVFVQLLLRPPWEAVTLLSDNLASQIRVLEGLLLLIDWGEAVPVDLSFSDIKTEAHTMPHSVNKDLNIQPWYWGEISKEEVNELMMDKKDGAFLVRDSTNRSTPGYTLTLRINGDNKLIRIYDQGGFVNFLDPPNRFRSVVDLIKYHENMSLASYNLQLNVCLKHPISKYFSNQDFSNLTSEQERNKLMERFSRYMKESELLNNSIEKSIEDFTVRKRELEENELMVKAIHTTYKMLLNQDSIIRQVLDELELQTASVSNDITSREAKCLQRLMSNRELLTKRIAEVQNVYNSEVKQRDQLQKQMQSINEQIHENKPKFKECSENMHKVMTILQTCFGVGRSMLQRATEVHPLRQFPTPVRSIHAVAAPTAAALPSNDMYDRLSIMVKSGISDPLTRREAWFCGNMPKAEAYGRLQGRPNGTFLVRTSSQYAGKFVLSVSVDGAVKECLIDEDMKSGRFGFHNTPCLFASLEDMVLHYHSNSLELHNKDMCTCLLFPINQTQEEDSVYVSSADLSSACLSSPIRRR